MNVWFIIWLLLSGSLIFFAGWTIYILYMQKSAWRDFAKKNKLRYSSGKFLASPELGGTLDGHTVGIFGSEHVAEDVRGSRKMTAIEVGLQSRFPVAGAVGSGAGMVQLIKGLSYSDEVRPEDKKWSTSYIARSNSANALESYLTPERIDALTGLMKMKNVWIIFIFEDRDTILRLDTPDPLDKTEKIEKTIKMLVDAAKVLELSAGEAERLEKVAAERSRKPKTKALDVKEEDIKSGGGLELEEESGT